ncbi:type II toxin-antitoxin system HicB family antitoxin [Candidatus Electronema sp. PJ]|uniref:type II toxin-antitoxin system HicB family antitoxin n=1 Tax=Candidatus Electronema sp. PJ TaxID=3401572 RepID=UPI003AA7E108
MTAYIAVVHKDLASDFGVSFPDFPGCISSGTSLEEIRVLATEALAGHIRTMIEFGEKIPAPSKMEDIVADPDYRDAAAFLVINVPVAQPKKVRIAVTFPEEMLYQIDAAAKKRGMSRSSFLAHAAQSAI